MGELHTVLALTIAHLTRRTAELHLSVRELTAELAGIGETVLLHHDGGKGRPRTQRWPYDLFNLDRNAPTR